MLPHHAVVEITSRPNDVLFVYQRELREHAEIVPYAVDALTIDDVRRIIALAYQTPGAYSVRIIVLTAQVINREAQHALLKVLEEPPTTTQFLILLPSLAGLLPTILSRVLVKHHQDDVVVSPVFEKFLQSSYKDRLELIADIAKRKAEADFMAMYDGLLIYGQSIGETKVLRLVDEAQRQLRQKGAGKKMIWEHIALSLPIASKK